MRFNFVANIEANDESSKVPYIRTGTTKKGNEYKSLSLSAVAARNNRAFMEMFGMKEDTIKTKDGDNNDIMVAWSDREDPDVVSQVANSRKYVIVMDDKRTEFISAYDFITFVCDNLKEIKGKRWIINGFTKKDFYNGNVRDRFQIRNMFEVTDDRKNQLRVSMNEFWSVDDIDTDNWEKEKVLTINGYTDEYIDGKTQYVPQQVVFDCKKIDYSNNRHVKVKDYKLRQLGMEEVDGKIKVNLKKKKVYRLNLTCNYVNGAEEVEFDTSTLDANQLEAIELGLKTIDDFRPSGSIYGNRVTAYKIVDFDLRGEAANGVYDSEFTTSEFEDLIYDPDAKESIDDVVAKSINAPSTDDIDDDDLFS